MIMITNLDIENNEHTSLDIQIFLLSYSFACNFDEDAFSE